RCSLDLKDFQFDRRSVSRAARHEHHAVQPRVTLVPRLESRRSAHVISAWVHRFTRRELADDLLGAVPVAVVGYIDERTVGGLQRIARIELRDTVAAHHLPVCAAGEHPAGKTGTGELSAGDRDDSAASLRRLA